MAQAVRTGARRFDAQPLESCCDNAVESTMSEWSARCVHTEKDLPMLSCWAHFMDVPGYGIRQRGNERAEASTTLLRRSNRQSLLVQVHILKTKTLDLTDAQSIDGKQEQHAPAANFAVSFRVCT